MLAESRQLVTKLDKKTHFMSWMDLWNASAREGMAGKYIFAPKGENMPAHAASAVMPHF